MNRYRAWIDRREWHILAASQLLSMLVMATLIILAQTLITDWFWAAWIAVAAIPLEVYLGIAQMTSWRRGPVDV